MEGLFFVTSLSGSYFEGLIFGILPCNLNLLSIDEPENWHHQKLVLALQKFTVK